MPPWPPTPERRGTRFFWGPRLAVGLRLLLGSAVGHADTLAASSTGPSLPPQAAPQATAKPAPQKADLQGSVRARGTRAAIPGARLTLRPASGRGDEQVAITDDAGEFRIPEVPPGIYRVYIQPRGGAQSEHRASETGLTVRGSERIRVTYYLAPAALPPARPFATTVHADSLALREEISRQTLTTEELSKIPGTLGDPLRAIENLPGVARPPFNTGLFIIEGARPNDSRVYLATAEVSQLYHYGAATSIVPAGFLDSIEYMPHNFGVRYGRATAGAIDVDLRAGRRDRWGGAVDLNPIHIGVEAEGPLGTPKGLKNTPESKRGSLLLGVRRSYMDAGLALANSIFGGPPGLRFVNAPIYWDYQAVLNLPVGPGTLRFMLIGSDDDIALRFARPQDLDPSVNGEFATHIQFHRGVLRWSGRVDGWDILLQNTTGFSGTDLHVGRSVELKIDALNSDSRLELRRALLPWLRVLLGADIQVAYVRMRAAVPVPLREGEFQRPPGTLAKLQIDSADPYINPAYYAEFSLKPHDRVSLTPGLRVDYFSYLGRFNVDPRLSGRVQVSPITWLKFGAGLYGQDPAPQDYFAAFGNRQLRLERAAQFSLAVEQAIWKGLFFEATAIYKHLWDFAGPSELYRRFGGGAQPDDIRPERTASQVSGRIYGGTFLLRQKLSRYFFGWFSYSLLRSERRDCDTCSNRIFDFDQTHILIAAVHAYLPYKFELGLRFRYMTGFPYSPARGGYYDSDADLYQPQFPAPSERNLERIEDFHQLDVRIDRTFTFKTWRMKLYIDVSNVYNHPQPEQTVYSFDYSQRAFITGLPILPSFGIRAEL